MSDALADELIEVVVMAIIEPIIEAPPPLPEETFTFQDGTNFDFQDGTDFEFN